MKRLLSLPLLLIVFVNISSQDKKTAMKFFEAGNFEEAIDEYLMTNMTEYKEYKFINFSSENLNLEKKEDNTENKKDVDTEEKNDQTSSEDDKIYK